ncbi:hypothetical protein FF100_04820 [Methylobacterium terricola]|uniref:Uncharacterized protein n=1 Tax=Methylobacterium terricola TaxID=2583531 RepID=A0A5C4LN74_9HYPH|nr:hypothetical protein [Methylobacterium terricola]TNC14901.1 hypothetical protein FF100_04820 [Methylobacterium terricola]
MHWIGYDESVNVLVIADEGVFPAGSLSVAMDGQGMVRIVGLARRTELYAHWTDIGTLESTTFADGATTLAYLTAELAKQRTSKPIALPFTAGEPIGGHKGVRIAAGGLVQLASSDDASQAGTVLGVSLAAADDGSGLDVAIIGEVTESSWSWAVGPVFLGIGGALTQAPPASGFVQQIGKAIGPHSLVVSLSTPIVLAQ